MHQVLGALDTGIVVLDAELRVLDFTVRAAELFTVTESDLGSALADLPTVLNYGRLAEDAAAVLRTGVPLEREMATTGGGWRLARLMPCTLSPADGAERANAVVIHFLDITALKASTSAAARSAAQQRAVAEIGARAMEGAPLGDLYDAATKAVCDLLEVEFCRVLELTSQGDALLLRAGRGWEPGLVGSALYPVAAGSQEAYILARSEPVVVSYLPGERRFALPPLLMGHGILSGINARLHGRAGVYGYLGAHSRAQRDFAPEDVSFVQSVANVLGQAIGRAQAEEAARLSEARFRMALRITPITLFTQDRDLRLTWVYNPVAEVQANFDSLLGVYEGDIYENAVEYEPVAAFKRRVMEIGQPARAEFPATVAGVTRWYDLMAEPLYNERREIVGLSAVTVDITDKKEVQARLEESEQRVRLALGTAPVALFAQDRELRILWMVNADPLVIAAHGDLAGLPERALYADPQEYAASAAFKRRIMKTGQPGREEMTVTFVGIRRVYAITAEPTFGPDGEVTGVICASMDITALKDTQARLEESEQRFRTALANTPITVFRQDRDLRYTWLYNPVAEAGERPEALIGHTDEELIADPVERAALVAFKRKVMQTGRAQRAELVLTFDRPHHFDVTAEPLLDAQGEVVGLTAAAFDTTELREVRAALGESEEMRRLALEAADLGAWAHDLVSQKSFWDARCREIFGVGQVEPATRRLWLDVIHPQDRAQAEADYRRATAPDGDGFYSSEIRIRRPDGAERWIDSVGRAHFEGEGATRRAVRLVGIVMDVTERKQAEEALRGWNAALERSVAERTAELQARNEELDRFAYVASHDLKSPLRGIRILAQWITEDAHDTLSGESREHLVKLVGRVDRMERLLDDLLLYSRAGRTRGSVEEFVFTEFVRDIVETLELPQGFTVTVADGERAIVYAERVPLELALRNLIANAAKHHHRPAAGNAWVSAEETGDAWVFTVVDDGPGIEPVFHRRIFDMFQTLRPRDQVEGSGVGLALVKKLVEMRGGQIHVESEPPGGARFRMVWPKSGDQ